MRTRLATLAFTLVLLMLLVGCSGRGGRKVIDFESAKVGQLPAGWISAVTSAPAGRWEVRSDPTSPAGPNVLVQADDDATSGRFPLCIYNGLTAKDVEVSVYFKPIAGKVDRGAGIVVRWQDKDNYYIARANGLEDNVRLYKVEGGKRRQFAGVEKVTPPGTGQWHRLTLRVVGSRFAVAMDGRELFTAEDSTFPAAGKVGLWTKADSITAFDGFTIEEE